MEKKLAHKYNADSIQVLEGIEAVRKRPGMYIGDTGSHGLHQIAYEVIDNSLDEALAGYATKIKVILNEDNSLKVIDDGRGIPISIHKKMGKSALEVVMTTLHAGGKFDNNAYKVSGGLHGVGVSVTNALSRWCKVIVERDGYKFAQVYKRGKPKSRVKKIASSNKTGTTVYFLPDTKIFESLRFDSSVLKTKLRELSYLNKKIKIYFKSKDGQEKFYSRKGLLDFIKALCQKKSIIYNKSVNIDYDKGGISVSIVFQHIDSIDEKILSYVNNIKTPDGGSHVKGFRTALTRAVNQFAKDNGCFKKDDELLNGSDICEGIVSIVSVRMPNPQFEGQTKQRLTSAHIESIVKERVYEELKSYFEQKPRIAYRIIDRALLARRAKEAAKKARDLVRRKGELQSFALPGKLADCSSDDVDRTELFLVEGDSAGGSAKQGRDRRYQAILPLRGKILNVEKAKLDKMLKNEELKTIIMALGTGIDNDFDIMKLRYGKIIIMCDSDIDGSHIRTLLLTFFYRKMRHLIEEGRVYAAQPPLYKIKKGKKINYILNEHVMTKLRSKIKDMSKFNVQRFKGLGEMNPEQLWETTMNPKSRQLLRMTINDAVKADEIFNVLMGGKARYRRRFIKMNAKEVRVLDV